MTQRKIAGKSKVLGVLLSQKDFEYLGNVAFLHGKTRQDLAREGLVMVLLKYDMVPEKRAGEATAESVVEPAAPEPEEA